MFISRDLSRISPLLLTLGFCLDLVSALPGKPIGSAVNALILRDVPPDRILNLNSIVLPGNASVLTNSTLAPSNVTSATLPLVNSTSTASGSSISVILPPPIKNGSKLLADAQEDALHQSLPYLLKQLGVDSAAIPELVSEGVPLLRDAILASIADQGGHPQDPAVLLARRGLFNSIGKWVKKVVKQGINLVKGPAIDAGCGVFAASTLGGYLLSADAFAVQNILKKPKATTPDQDFYIYPLHGSISHDDGIRIFYNANFPPGFGEAAGVTMGRNIYLREAAHIKYTDSNFLDVTKILLHEFTHSEQYRALGYNLHAFGLRYLFEYCKAGFSYKKNSLEVDAYKKQEYLNSLFSFPGTEFVKVWNQRGVQQHLGLPKARIYSSPGNNQYSLALQKGTLSITCGLSSCS
ncbi:hypothetical protein JMJ35_010331 [Cladonia borealis]|uniref:Uncharacterized protein n=1 Tax=Cladonia borealis TaxID=184061 RepID=A0AA39QT81_9LECA|nr:hypothetical protein JMJ35_010331 [Cladonia borealis]